MSIYIFQPSTGGGGGGNLEQTLSSGANVTGSYTSTISSYWYWDTPSIKFADFATQQGFYFDSTAFFLRVGDITTGSGSGYNLEIDYNAGQIKFNDYYNNIIAGFEYTSGGGSITPRQLKIGDFNLGHYITFLANYTTANWDTNRNWLWVDYVNDKIQIGSTDNFGSFNGGIRFITNTGLTLWGGILSSGIVSYSNLFTFDEASAGGGQLKFQGTGWTSTSAGGNSGNHLIVYINGVMRKIALLLP